MYGLTHGIFGFRAVIIIIIIVADLPAIASLFAEMALALGNAIQITAGHHGHQAHHHRRWIITEKTGMRRGRGKIYKQKLDLNFRLSIVNGAGRRTFRTRPTVIHAELHIFCFSRGNESTHGQLQPPRRLVRPHNE